ncbi:hypothetical protein GB937_007103 [Aspergillus fischeri]|nr:hypothetical protein GB937_007103 [Aspergillus fischeri]
MLNLRSTLRRSVPSPSPEPQALTPDIGITRHPPPSRYSKCQQNQTGNRVTECQCQIGLPMKSRDAFAAAPFTFPANGSGII